MSVTLNLRPETQARLQVQAVAAGMSPEEYLLAIVESTPFSAGANPQRQEERAAPWIEAAGRLSDTPLLSDEAVSRESMYTDYE
jgi:hypothetical protein